ncbi:hypothetical protein BCR36DRAFT_246366, partial [Piromyces finnis]
CGKDHGKCPSGQCCGLYGYCRIGNQYHGKGCQSEFGECDNNLDKNKINFSTDGVYDVGEGVCPDDQCFSKYGYC